MGSLVAVLASAFVLVAPPDWTAAPSDPPLEEVVVSLWAETPAGLFIPEIPQVTGYMEPGAHLVLDTSGVQTGQTICIQGFAVKMNSSLYATIEPVCAPNGDGLAPPWVVPP